MVVSYYSCLGIYSHPDRPLAFIVDFVPASKITESSQGFEISISSRGCDEVLEGNSGGGGHNIYEELLDEAGNE